LAPRPPRDGGNVALEQESFSDVGQSLAPPGASAHSEQEAEALAALDAWSAEIGPSESAEVPDNSSDSEVADDSFDPTPVHRAEQHKDRPSRRRGRRAPPPRLGEAKLAAAVAEIREVEDSIVSGMRGAAQVMRRLEERGAHLDAGYASPGDFEQSILSFTPVLKAMRDSAPVRSGRRPRANGSGRHRSSDRARRTKALVSIADGLERLRHFDDQIRRAAVRARNRLRAIEAERLFEECGYASFEEFLDRALGESPILASAVALADQEPSEPIEPIEDEATRAPSRVAEESANDLPAGLLELTPEPHPAEARAAEAPRSPPAAVAPRSPVRLALPIALSVCLSILATFAGAAVGSWVGEMREQRQSTSEAANEVPSPAAAHKAAHGASAVDASVSPPSEHARPSGPREAHLKAAQTVDHSRPRNTPER